MVNLNKQFQHLTECINRETFEQDASDGARSAPRTAPSEPVNVGFQGTALAFHSKPFKITESGLSLVQFCRL